MQTTVVDSSLDDKRVCVFCSRKPSKNKSFSKRKNRVLIYYNWLYDKQKRPICHRCYRSKLTNIQQTNNKRRYTFGKKIFYLSYNPRTGYCSQCPKNIPDGSAKKTDMHHSLGYFIIFPWFGMIELCYLCHKNTFVYRKKQIPPWHKKRLEGYISHFMSTMF